jgi:hypothetical protein
MRSTSVFCAALAVPARLEFRKILYASFHSSVLTAPSIAGALPAGGAYVFGGADRAFGEAVRIFCGSFPIRITVMSAETNAENKNRMHIHNMDMCFI